MTGPTNFDKIRGLRWQLAGNAFTSIFATTNFFGGSMFILFLNELKLDTAHIGFLLSLLQLFGIVALFSAPYTARFGVKRTWVGYCIVRVGFAAMLPFTPFVLRMFGTGAAFALLAISASGFALAKAVGETANTAWQQEIIPDIIRGKFSALNAIITQLLGAATILLGGYLVGEIAGLKPYIILISGGLISGILCVWCYGHMPGGKPIHSYDTNTSHFNEMYESLAKDRNFLKYIIGLVLVSIGFAVALTFVALFMKNEIGLPSRVVIWLDIATFAGTIGTSYLWGWAADRYGSKPVMLIGPLLLCLFPVICFVMPRHTALSVLPAIMVTFIIGMANMAWNIGFQRYLYVTAVPPGQKTAYTAVYYACYSLAGTIGVSASGIFLKLTPNFHASFLLFSIDQYILIFALGMVITFAGIMVLSTLRGGADIPVFSLLRMFVTGNPLVAIWALLMHKYAKSEHARLRIIHRLGRSRSPLSKFELINSLHDPCFNVRLEAIIAIANRKPEKDLVTALEQAIQREHSQIVVIAVWALGRMGAVAAIPTLRKVLVSQYPTLRCAAARALATLGDIESIGCIGQALSGEKKLEVKIDYAYALGRLKAEEYCSDILAIMASCDDASVWQEASLAVAMLVGDEGEYVKLLHQFNADHATGAAQALWTLKKPLAVKGLINAISQQLEPAAAAFARNDFQEGNKHLAILVAEVGALCQNSVAKKILAECVLKINPVVCLHQEYVLLAIYTIGVALDKPIFIGQTCKDSVS